MIDLSGTEVASYVYDAWGNIKETNGEPTIREINPIRYRGYVYDTETSLYYLQSRYYDPFTGRFINADIYCDTYTGNPLSTNMFAYCENNPIIHADKTGKFGTPLQWAMAAIGGIAGWFLGTGGSPGQIAKQLFPKYAKYIFSKKHIEDGIMKLGTSQMSIFNKVLLENY